MKNEINSEAAHVRLTLNWYGTDRTELARQVREIADAVERGVMSQRNTGRGRWAIHWPKLYPPAAIAQAEGGAL